ncbi:MAG: metallophosphoesterase, partial [Lachnospiraceae bacterium]|nr:metallophosphoesterase [Lachnospiraceae bacterium]
KVYYISDLHLNMRDRKGFGNLSDEEYIQHAVRKMDGNEPFGDSPLIILGDIANDKDIVDYFFCLLRMRREGPIIYVLGNHECPPHIFIKGQSYAFRKNVYILSYISGNPSS